MKKTKSAKNAKSMKTLIWALGLVAAVVGPASGPASAQLTTLWARTFGGASNDAARSIEATSDGGYVLAGYTYSLGAGESDIYLIKTDATGRETWSRVIGGPGRDYAFDVCQTNDGGYVLTGYAMSAPGSDKDLCLYKIDAAGGIVWSRTYGGPETDEGWAVDELSDGSLLVAGRTESRGAGGSDFYVLRLEADGDTLWTRTFGGAEWDWATSVCETSDGNCAVVGTTGSTSGNRDVWVVKITPAGEAIWTRPYGSLVTADADWGWAVLPTDEGGIVLTGHGNDHVILDAGETWLIHTDAGGVADWAYTYGGTNYYEHGHGLCATDDGGYLVCGIKKIASTQRNVVLLIKTDGEGNEQWIQSLAGAGHDWASGVVSPSPGRYAVAGYTDGSGAGRFDAWLVNLLDPTAQDIAIEAGPRNAGDAPPPATQRLRLEVPSVFCERADIRFGVTAQGGARLAILDVTGREVACLWDGELPQGDREAFWQADAQPSGVYYCALASEGRTLTRRMTLLR